ITNYYSFSMKNNDGLKMPEERFGSSQTEENQPYLGIVLSVLILLLIFILGGLYMWGKTMENTPEPVVEEVERPTAEENNEPESTNAEADVQVLETSSPSNEMGAIRAELESTDTTELNTELQAIEDILR